MVVSLSNLHDCGACRVIRESHGWRVACSGGFAVEEHALTGPEKVVLRDAGIAEKTQQRYFMCVRRVLPILEASAAMTDMDSRIADWIQTQWEKRRCLTPGE